MWRNSTPPAGSGGAATACCCGCGADGVELSDG